jgi:hypothetical protein
MVDVEEKEVELFASANGGVVTANEGLIIAVLVIERSAVGVVVLKILRDVLFVTANGGVVTANEGVVIAVLVIERSSVGVVVLKILREVARGVSVVVILNSCSKLVRDS